MFCLFVLLSFLLSPSDGVAQYAQKDFGTQTDGFQQSTLWGGGIHEKVPDLMGYGGTYELRSDIGNFFKKLDSQVGYLLCSKERGMLLLQNSGTQVGNVFAELQRRCVKRKGTPHGFMMRLRDR